MHSGIDPQRFEKTTGEHLLTEFDIKENQTVVINVAHLAGHKGHKYLVRAIPHVLKKIPQVRFFIVGGGELKDELKALAASLNLDSELVFTGYRQDVGAFYKIADLFVMSSVQEGLGTSVLDALATGIPVVATNSGGIPEIISDGKTGRLVDAANPMALAQGIVDSLTHPENTQKMANKGLNLVRQNFSIQAMVSKNIEVYQNILSLAG